MSREIEMQMLPTQAPLLYGLFADNTVGRKNFILAAEKAGWPEV